MTKSFFRQTTDPIFVPDLGPNTAPPPSLEIYGKMGEENIRAMLRDFYLKLGNSAISGMFPEDLIHASEKSALFFVSLLGGPPLYVQKYGPPRMRARHMPFRITAQHRTVWLACFFEVLDDPDVYQFPREHLEPFKNFLAGFSAWMVNTAED